MQWIFDSGALIILVLAISYDYGYDFAGLHIMMLLAFHCRYYVSFLPVELALVSNEFLLCILLFKENTVRF